MTERESVDLETYKIIETRLYGELMKACRRYSNDLSLISVFGILELVKQEMSELDKTGRTFTKTQLPETDKSLDKHNLETIQ